MKKILLALACVGLSGAHAQALLSHNCGVASKIVSPPNATGFHMSADCKTVYVLPPAEGSVSFEGFTESSSMQRCDELDGVLKNLKDLSDKITSAKFGATQAEAPKPVVWPCTGVCIPSMSSVPKPVTVAANPISEEELNTLLQKRYKLAKDIVSEFGSIPALVAQLNYKTGYGDLLTAFKKKNPSLDVSFLSIPLKNTHFKFLSPDFKEKEFSMGISAGFPIAQSDLMSGSTSGAVELSLLGACPLRSTYSGRMPRTLPARKIAPILTASLSYDYELMTSVDYTASYSVGGLASKIRETSSKGGFFSTSTASTLIEKTSSDSWFKYTYTCEDSRACDAHKETQLEIKKRLMDEVLGQISIVKLGYDLSPEAAGAPRTNGATSSGRAIRDNCKHIYCQAAGAFLEVIGSMGSESKTDTLIRTESHFRTESSSEKKPFSFSGSIGFAPKDTL